MERQNDEIEALESIYDHFRYIDSDRTGVISIPVEIPETGIQLITENVKNIVNYLPPVNLTFTLHDDYPMKLPPKLKLSCAWLDIDQLVTLENHLQEEFEEDSEVLFDWISTVKDTAFDLLELENGVNLLKFNKKRKILLKNGNRLESSYRTANKIIPVLIEFDNHEKREAFNRKMVKCDVCLENKSGCACLKLSCDHIFCQKCLEEYFSILISEGTVGDLKCPSCGDLISPNIIKETISEELFERFDRLMLERSLEKMEDIHYCPRPSCRTPCIILSKEDSTCLCASCQFCFCILCERSSHGTSPCAVNSSRMKGIFNEYQEATDRNDQAKIKSLLAQYGANLQHLIGLHQNLEFIRENSMPCPKCRQAIQKIEGCNKMTCSTCQTCFCYLCGAICDRSNPYSHFSNIKSACFGNLFQGIDENMMWEFDQYE